MRGVAVAGVGRVPRAYIALKPGFSLPGEELATWLNSRLEWRHRWGAEGKTSKEMSVILSVCVRLRGGVVVVDRLTRDSQGTLLVNLDRFDREVVAETSFGPGERCGLVTEI